MKFQIQIWFSWNYFKNNNFPGGFKLKQFFYVSGTWCSATRGKYKYFTYICLKNWWISFIYHRCIHEKNILNFSGSLYKKLQKMSQHFQRVDDSYFSEALQFQCWPWKGPEVWIGGNQLPEELCSDHCGQNRSSDLYRLVPWLHTGRIGYYDFLNHIFSVVDPGFPGGASTPKEGQPISWPILPKNCMKMKTIWPRGQDWRLWCTQNTFVDLCGALNAHLFWKVQK